MVEKDPHPSGPPDDEKRPPGGPHGGEAPSPASPSSSETVSLSIPGGDEQTLHIGAYRLLERLGEGGMGVVYLAEQQEPIRRQVALKVIKLGMDTMEVIARFETERPALAMMNHPNIAQVYDAGSTDTGRPYFVMEYVPGVAITDYCDRNRLSTRERLELFIPVCEAVHHAHQKGIIHRDLKPSNVLVALQDGRPVAKVIDFGVAKATAKRLTERTLYTEQGRLIGTPEYMSPEQAEMTGLNIDTTSDVYSLGVMLYELLTGSLPFTRQSLGEVALTEIHRVIREVDPPKASTRISGLGKQAATGASQRRTAPQGWVRQVRGELDWITMRAMEKDRTRRYPSASELAADIARHLANEPVLTRRPGTAYQLKKMVLRHKVHFGLAAMLVVVLTGFAVTMSIQAGRIARARDRANLERDGANLEAQAAEEVSDFLVRLFEVSDPGEARGNTITARQMLDSGAQKIREELSDQPMLRARLMGTIGHVYMRLGLYDQARLFLEEALVTLRDLLGEEHLKVAKCINNLAILKQKTGEYEDCRALHECALAIREEILGPDHLDVAKSLNNLAFLDMKRGDFENALPLFRRSLAIFERALGPGHPHTINVVCNLACLAALQNDRDTAIAELQHAPDRGLRDGEIADDPLLTSLHGDPEFEAILAEIERRNR